MDFPADSPFVPTRSDVDLPRQEHAILELWERGHIFEKSVQGRAGAKPYRFYDGPPFATGLPHYGHILAGVLKDIVPRYWTMKGYSVPRRFGWDCHGLPVENEINQTLGLTSRKDILAYGVARYNAACRSIVSRYASEWKHTVRRVGRWVDMENAYFTMNVSFMQSVWAVFRRLWDDGLIYEGYKVVPYSTGISTVLSNFEAGLNYKDVQDPAVTVAFSLLDAKDTAILAWTTTPWTLPSNLALAVHRDTPYVRFRDAHGKSYYVAEARLEAYVDKATADIEEHTTGAALLGRRYQPLFPFFAERASEGAFRVIHSDHVTTESGTGVVHIAPAYGEDDYYACQREGIAIVNPVDDDGVFTAEVGEFAGKKVKDADKDIIARLKQAGQLYRHDTLVHSYPFCWRTDTPLIYRAVSSWFVSVEKLKERLLAQNATTRWVPEHLRDGRFGNWLANARDWAISRNRFWGTPLPVWRNAEGETVCVGSRAELERLSGQEVPDLHIEFVDAIEIPSPTGGSPLRRIEPVLDCWFESGAMPYAQVGWPEDHPDLSDTFPAEFIAEGLDQTRGWFYTLMVLGTALFDQAPFKNVVVNGLILAEDGKKMSKRLRNYPDPMELLERHGADALRLYLIDSPVVRAQELRFSEAGVKEITRRILLRWWNAYSFFVSYANVDNWRPSVEDAAAAPPEQADNPNVLDRWLLSRLHSLIDNTQREMEAYNLNGVVPHLLRFIEDLTNTYIRFGRAHFWQEGMPAEKAAAYATLYRVLLTLAKVMAPFAPFLAEVTYQNLTAALPASARCESVHLESFPEATAGLIQPELEAAVAVMDEVVELARNFRERTRLRAKIPLAAMTIVHRDPALLAALRLFEPYLRDELNFREVRMSSDEAGLLKISAKANFKALGSRLGPQMKSVAAAVAALAGADLEPLERGEPLTVLGHTLGAGDVELVRAPRDAKQAELVGVGRKVAVLFDPTHGPAEIMESVARELIRKVQATRKAARLALSDRIKLQLACSGDYLAAAEAHRDWIARETQAHEVTLTEGDSPWSGQHSERFDLDGEIVTIAVEVHRGG
ncbi:MAG: isoleucine--tRNA ligase [Myxococcales bacterium]|nr:isoleucine--tRNA ligase [Myxococcales bacterium]